MILPPELVPPGLQLGCDRIRQAAELCDLAGVPRPRGSSSASILGQPDASFFDEDPDNRPFLWDLDPEEE